MTTLLPFQVGINVLGVVENMSGLSQAAENMSFIVRDGDEGNAGGQDVSEAARKLLLQHFGKVFHHTHTFDLL